MQRIKATVNVWIGLLTSREFEFEFKYAVTIFSPNSPSVSLKMASLHLLVRVTQ